MLVIVRSAHDTPEGKRGVRIAREMSADVVLLQNGVSFLLDQRLEDLGFAGTTYVLADDRKLRGLKESEGSNRIQEIEYDGLIDIMEGSSKVIGMF